MKKTFTINISGSIFHIDEDAYEKLQRYLHMLNRHFGVAIEGQEILQDIEARIAELFLEKTSNKVEVITDAMVEEVIARMGKPEDFMEAEEEPSAKSQPEEPSATNGTQAEQRLYRDGNNRLIGGVCSGLGNYFKIDPVIVRVIFVVTFGISLLAYLVLWIVVPEYQPYNQPNDQQVRRRLYRDGDNRVFGGVCSGLGAYFNIDMVVLRVIFVVLFFLGAASLLMYIILWIVVPKARTTAQRLEMRGKEANVSNIEKSIKEEMNEVGDNNYKFKNPKDEQGQARVDRFGNVVNSSSRVVGRTLALILGALLIIGGIAGLIGFVTSMTMGHVFFYGDPWNFGWHHNIDVTSLINNLVNPEAMNILLVTIPLLFGIPILLILFVGTKLLFRYKTNNKLIGLGAFGIWLVALVIAIVVSVNQVVNFKEQTSQTVTQKIDCSKCKTIYLEPTEDLYESLIYREISFDRMKVVTINGKQKILGHPRFTIEKSNSGEYLLLIKKQSRGRDIEDAQKNMEQIEYNLAQKDSTLHIDPYYFLKDDAKWRVQEVAMTLKVPEGKAIYIDPKMEDLIYNIENTENMWDGDMVGKTWIMTANGLALKDSIGQKK